MHSQCVVHNDPDEATIDLEHLRLGESRNNEQISKLVLSIEKGAEPKKVPATRDSSCQPLPSTKLLGRKTGVLRVIVPPADRTDRPHQLETFDVGQFSFEMSPEYTGLASQHYLKSYTDLECQKLIQTNHFVTTWIT